MRTLNRKPYRIRACYVVLTVFPLAYGATLALVVAPEAVISLADRLPQSTAALSDR